MQNSLAKAKREKNRRSFSTPQRFSGEMLEVLSDIMSVGNLDAVLQKIGTSIAELFSIKTLVIGVLDESDHVFRVRATYGYDPESDKKIKKFVYTYERLKFDMDEKYRIAEDVFLIRPKPKEFIKREEPFYKHVPDIHKPRTDPRRWHELDYIRNYVVYVGSGNSVTLSGLTIGTTHYVSVYEVNGTGGLENYLTSSPATGSAKAVPNTYYSFGTNAPTSVAVWYTAPTARGVIRPISRAVMFSSSKMATFTQAEAPIGPCPLERSLSSTAAARWT